jgi:hypothetical protein
MFIKEKRRVVVAQNTANFKTIYFINVDKYDEQGTLSEESSEDMDSITVTATSGQLRSVSQGETSNEVLYTTASGKSERSERGGEEPQHPSASPTRAPPAGEVGRVCALPVSDECDPAVRNRKLLYGGSNIQGIAALVTKGTYLIVNSNTEEVLECPLLATNAVHVSSCSLFAYQPEGYYWDPYGVLFEPASSIVYVSDYFYSLIQAFSIEGVYMGRVGEKKGYLTNPNGMAINSAAPFPRLCSITLLYTLHVAGTPVVFQLSFRTSFDEPLESTYDIAADRHLIHAEATYIESASGASITTPCSVLYDADAPPSTALSVSCALNVAPPPARPPLPPPSLPPTRS